MEILSFSLKLPIFAVDNGEKYTYINSVVQHRD